MAKGLFKYDVSVFWAFLDPFRHDLETWGFLHMVSMGEQVGEGEGQQPWSVRLTTMFSGAVAPLVLGLRVVVGGEGRTTKNKEGRPPGAGLAEGGGAGGE